MDVPGQQAAPEGLPQVMPVYCLRVQPVQYLAGCESRFWLQCHWQAAPEGCLGKPFLVTSSVGITYVVRRQLSFHIRDSWGSLTVNLVTLNAIITEVLEDREARISLVWRR